MDFNSTDNKKGASAVILLEDAFVRTTLTIKHLSHYVFSKGIKRLTKNKNGEKLENIKKKKVTTILRRQGYKT